MCICPYVRVCVCACLSLCMRHKNEFGTQMKNTHTDLIWIQIRIRDAHTQLVKNTLRALYDIEFIPEHQLKKLRKYKEK